MRFTPRPNSSYVYDEHIISASTLPLFQDALSLLVDLLAHELTENDN
jgi:hypothetical protein